MKKASLFKSSKKKSKILCQINLDKLDDNSEDKLDDKSEDKLDDNSEVKQNKNLDNDTLDDNNLDNTLKQYDVNKIVVIQKYIRGYLVRKYMPTHACKQTKNWRKKQKWYHGGKSNECEKYQLELIHKIIGKSLVKTNKRINMESYLIDDVKYPMNKKDGYEWTENFDGYCSTNECNYYFNLKFVCDNGGAQTRTLREVYHFIKYQIGYLKKHGLSNVYFINILDGDTSHKNMDKFGYLLSKNKQLKKYVFIGSMHTFRQNKHYYKL